MSGAPSILFAGGGTGGHVFPALAIAESVLELEPNARISFAGARDRLEAEVVPRYGFAFDPIWIAGFRRSFSPANLLFPVKVVAALLQSRRIIRTRRPDVVVGTGGYAAGPVVFTAVRLGCRTLIQEQNAYPGFTTRFLAPRVDEVHVGFPSTREYLGRARRVVVSGSPVRPSLVRIPAAEARRFFGFDEEKPTVFVFGGSLGAQSINAAVAAMLPRFETEGVQLIWQTGMRTFEQFRRCGESRPHVVIRPFIHEMHAAYSAATIVVCRAGAASIAEITAMGVPSILVPYPHAAADHQRRNAHALADAGASCVVEDDRLEVLEQILFELVSDKAALERMAEAARRLGKPGASRAIAEAVLRLAAR
ncbi:MAG: undecaprenyldiphospho-muramoylpentapeptide beta-N-acetylglucosaminyltransferase [Bacteroidota bacterium]|nr:undecaprenyldiphospho-muramoylpentapeptide beta-N-acetylglucosaminyltransferase [Bacteroidota bacterium]